MLFGFYALLGMVDAAFGVAFASLLSRHDLQTSALAGAMLCGVALALPLLWTGGRAVARAGGRRALRAVALLVPVLALALFAAPSPPALLGAAALLVMVTALLDVAAGTSALALEARSGRTLLGRAQSGFALGAVVGAVAGGLLVGGPGEPGLVLLVTALAGVLLLGSRRLPRGTDATMPGTAAGRAPLRVGLALVGLVALGAAYAEGLVGSWGALYLQRDLGASTALAGTLSGGYYLVFGLGAALSGVLLQRLGARLALTVLLFAAALGAALLAAPHLGLAAGGLWVLGAALAGTGPALFTWAARLGLGGSAAGFVTTFSYAGMLLEPLAVGLSADGLRPVMHALPALLVLTAATALLGGLRRPTPGAAALPVAGD